MTSLWKHVTIGLIVLVVVASSAVVSEAQWAVSYYRPYTSYYAPSAYSAYYAPATAYQSYYAPATSYQSYYAPATTAYYAPVVQTSAWYPGYWWDRVSSRLWGGRTVVAGYPTTYAASYPSSYVASYPSSYVASYPSSYVASYPTSYVASYPTAYSVGYSGCSTCAPIQQVSMRPVCTTGCSTCEPCSGCGVTAVTQTGYVESSPACTNCAPAAVSTSPTPVTVPSSTYESGGQQPTVPTGTPSTDRNSQRPVGDSAVTPAVGPANGIQPAGGAPSGSQSIDQLEKYLNENDKDAYFKAPELFKPNANDKAVQYSPAPVKMAVYQRPAGAPRDRVTTQPISLDKAKRDAVGWASAGSAEGR